MIIIGITWDIKCINTKCYSSAETYVVIGFTPTATWNVLPVKLSVSTANLLLAVNGINIWDYTINNTFCFWI